MFALALRNLFRHRTRSAVALSAIVFSTIALTLSGGFIEWIFWAMREAATEAGMGHVQVMRPGYLENGIADPFSFVLPGQSQALDAIKASPHVKAVSPRLDFTGLASFGDVSLAFVGTGVEAEKEAIVSRNLAFVAGRNLEPGDSDGVIVGQGLARQLGVEVGSKLVLLVNTRGGGVNAAEAQVRGVFATQIKAVDDIGLRVPLKIAQRLMRVSGAHEWVILLDDVDRVDDTVQDFRTRFDRAKFSFIPWTDLADFYNKTVKLLNSQLVVVRLMIGVIIILGISNMLVMNVLERTGEIGTLMALGTRRNGILSLFISEGFFLGFLGGAVGLLVAYVLAHLISAIGIPMPPPPGRTIGYSAEIRLTWPLCLSAFVTAFGTTLIASFYPARKASRLVIVDALRHNR